MFKKFLVDFLLFLTFGLLTYIYAHIKMGTEIDKVFITLSTFLFSIFVGFFISKQSSRYTEIRKCIADYDGLMSSFYRAMQHFSKQAQASAGTIIASHYQNILNHGWDYPFTNKTTTLTDLHILSEEVVQTYGTDGIKNAVINRHMIGLQELQKLRKNLVSLREERIPTFQWSLILLIATILTVTISTVTSVDLLFLSSIKAAFVCCIVVAVVLLYKLDTLELFSGNIGEHSAQDVLNIIQGTK